jgi:hypothetical protein
LLQHPARLRRLLEEGGEAACPFSTGRGTRRVRSVRGEGRGVSVQYEGRGTRRVRSEGGGEGRLEEAQDAQEKVVEVECIAPCELRLILSKHLPDLPELERLVS